LAEERFNRVFLTLVGDTDKLPLLLDPWEVAAAHTVPNSSQIEIFLRSGAQLIITYRWEQFLQDLETARKSAPHGMGPLVLSGGEEARVCPGDAGSLAAPLPRWWICVECMKTYELTSLHRDTSRCPVCVLGKELEVDADLPV